MLCVVYRNILMENSVKKEVSMPCSVSSVVETGNFLSFFVFLFPFAYCLEGIYLFEE
jgi:hypothetical protein